jgi:hypothetical protein
MQLQQLTDKAQARTHPFVTYAPHTWSPRGGNNLLQVDAIGQVTRFEVGQTPDAIAEWLPRPLHRAEYTAHDLDLVMWMQSAYTQSGAQWVETLLTETLPAAPDLPPQTMQVWLDQWFTSDTWGIQEQATAPWAVPALPNPPLYSFGNNPDWIYPLHKRD